ncbi:putative manganese-dependent inorganic diphosphatase [Gordonibacter massiliensis (ex Traore et al. 2017)]|uniref:inorganic diphosphatase n=1 Tax=Gordonibacter massiliensis (ex Traore et al. 2017) TaxID=1841863 RepID=A0A842JCV6_9ACTN|nr:putative manganese-dependent inorganic diphosphatase [Gordonibacter massiliensis (ex Traore et al. 2017)]MBC2889507.1 putative manganese-dependent inorganic diphosphatase [Gordonibacter massiliensis (ex Traore et al. 2017)]MBX9034381.1 putative manganese-dependent inorganic diphosphatase [Gordonibacter massiliensis (ex Traore et al. 2017)]
MATAAPIIVVGHKNPDNDSICAAVGYAYLKNELARRAANGKEPYPRYLPARLGPLPPESAWVLERNGVPVPEVVSHVHARVSDVMTPDPISIGHDATLLEAGRLLRQHNVRALVVTNDDGTYRGLITTRMIAERYVAATDALEDGGANEMAVAGNLIASLGQKVSDIIETDVLELDKNGLLKEAVEDLMASALREAVVLDEHRVAIGIVTRSDVAVRPRRKVVLVDHNETRQAANGIEEADVVEIVDHHRIADVSTANPILFLNLPVGSTATIVATEFERHDVEMPPAIAAVLLSAIMTDTVILKSPTATDMDREQVERLAALAGVDATEFGLAVFKCRGGEDSMPVDKLVGADSKEFLLGDTTVLIAQHETVDLPAVMKREGEIREHMRRLRDDHHYDFVLLMVTDILAEGSQFLCEGNLRIVNRVFNIDCSGEGGTWMPGVLSRKKQVAAKILGA